MDFEQVPIPEDHPIRPDTHPLIKALVKAMGEGMAVKVDGVVPRSLYNNLVGHANRRGFKLRSQVIDGTTTLWGIKKENGK